MDTIKYIIETEIFLVVFGSKILVFTAGKLGQKVISWVYEFVVRFCWTPKSNKSCPGRIDSKDSILPKASVDIR